MHSYSRDEGQFFFVHCRVWSGSGWLSWGKENPLFGIGVLDFAGTTVVHMVGGISACCGAYFIGPRKGRYLANGEPNPDWDAGHSVMLICTGTMVLWTGWYGFNSGSALVIFGTEALVGRTAVVTTMGACGGAVAALLHSQFITKVHCFGDLCNGALCGLVAITASGSIIAPWAGIMVGFIGAVLFMALEPQIARLGIDDAVGATAMHGCVGFWGTLVPGFFAREVYVRELLGDTIEGNIGAFSATHPPELLKGVVYGGNGKILACQVVGAILLEYPHFRSTFKDSKRLQHAMA